MKRATLLVIGVGVGLALGIGCAKRAPSVTTSGTSAKPTVAPGARPTPQATDASVSSEITSGWTQQSWTYVVHKPYDLALEDRFRYTDGVFYLWVYKSDNPFEVKGKSARCELRWQNNYTAGNHMFDGDIWVVPPIESTTVIQVFGGVTNATASQIRAFADGTLRRYNSPVVATDAFDRWTNIKIHHDADANIVRIYAADTLKSTEPDRGDKTHYFKCGVYGPGGERAETRFRNLRHWMR